MNKEIFDIHYDENDDELLNDDVITIITPYMQWANHVKHCYNCIEGLDCFRADELWEGVDQ